jgi:hypothetical protein
MQTQTVIETTKWATLLNHIKNNRTEYILGTLVLHIMGATNRLYSQVEGVCI